MFNFLTQLNFNISTPKVPQIPFLNLTGLAIHLFYDKKRQFKLIFADNSHFNKKLTI